MIKKRSKKGISLITLVITIIIVIILAGAVIFTLINNNVINNASKAVFLNDVDTFESELLLYHNNEFVYKTGDYDEKLLYADENNLIYGTQIDDTKNITDVVHSLKDTRKYAGEFAIVEGKLVYRGGDGQRKQWSQEIGLEVYHDEIQITITTVNTLPLKSGNSLNYSIEIVSSVAVNYISLDGMLRIVDLDGNEIDNQPEIDIVNISGSQNDSVRNVMVAVDTTQMEEGVYKLKLLSDGVKNIHSISNKEDILSLNSFEIDDTPPTNPTFTIEPSNIENWVSGSIVININYALDSDIKEYRLDDGNWQIYTGSITIASNLIIYARAMDIAGNVTTGFGSTLSITRIDNTIPQNALIDSLSVTGNTISASIALNDNESGIDLSNSKYIINTNSALYGKDDAIWNSAQAKVINVIPKNISEMKEDNDYYIHILSVDNVGNKKVDISNKVTIAAEIANAPVLATGMTPIKWNGSSWVTTTTSDSGWYNYNQKQWANARTSDGSMWVWIPRYVYKISSLWHTSSSSAGIIDIKFSKGTDDNWDVGAIGELNNNIGAGASNGTYTRHPAFKFGTIELNGIWIAKFEASNSSGKVKIVPNVISWRNLHATNIYTTCKSMETDNTYGWGTSGTGIDVHLSKSIEWGVVSYFTQSKYGKNSKVWINPDSNYTTGRAGGSVDAVATTSTYAYDNLTYGVNASTTGNIYGVYDMSGCAWEYISAYVNNGNSVLTSYGGSIISAASQYKDVYAVTTDSQVNNYNNSIDKKGDAIYETSSSTGSNSWYNGHSTMGDGGYPFIVRGGNFNAGINAGLFTFGRGSGYNSTDIGFRPVLLVNSGL